MDEFSNKWLAEFRKLNRADITRAADDSKRGPLRALSTDLAQPARRKGPHRLNNIIKGDALAIRVTNLRARAGMKPTKITR